MLDIHSDKSLEAMRSIMDSMGSNQVWTLIDQPKGVKSVGCKWVYKHNLGTDGEVTAFKTRPVVKGYGRKMIFLNGFVEEHIYMDQPEGFTSVGEDQKCTKLDVAYALSVMSSYQACAREADWSAVKTILKYLKRTKNMFLIYGDREEGYRDTSFQSDNDDAQSQSNFVFKLNDGVVAWNCSKQSTMVDSTTEAEYIATLEAFKETAWMKKLHPKVGCHHLLKEMVSRGDVRMNRVSSVEKIADPLTKPISQIANTQHLDKIDMADGCKMIFLNGFVEEHIYMDQPEGFTSVGEDQKINGSLVAHLVLYVDDLLLTRNDVKMLGDNKAWLSTQFPMKDVENLEKIQDEKLKMRIHFDKCTKLDVAYALSVMSSYQACAREADWSAVKTILKYLKRTKNMFLIYGDREEGYRDTSFQSDNDDAKSQSNFVFKLNDGVVAWNCSKQSTMVDSITEAEYIATLEAFKETAWMKNYIQKLGVVPSIAELVVIFCDNNRAVAQIKGLRSHQCSKHRCHHLLKEMVSRGDVRMNRVSSVEKIADPLTKPISQIANTQHLDKIGYNFIKNKFDPCIYMKINGSLVAHLVLYVDDLLLTRNDVKMLGDNKAWLSTQFPTKDMAIKNIQYVVQCTKLDVAYALSVMSSYQACAREADWSAVKTILKAVAQIKELRSHQCSKHRCHHLLKEMVSRGDVRMNRVSSAEKIADPLTKPISQIANTQHLDKIAKRLQTERIKPWSWAAHRAWSPYPVQSEYTRTVDSKRESVPCQYCDSEISYVL
ncbi:UNVERIFIED_CONTAM: Copia protein [Sesamum calycinum]|uniref:Copia protein n=1 Tax=Sesamum calycinum TaxID=2727403 RepID=A0AAW2PBW5_9LAMI